MIGEGEFATQLNTAEGILKHLELLEERQQSPTRGLGASDFKGLNYRQSYAKYVAEYAYDFRLSDQSLLWFNRKLSPGGDVVGLSYSFIEAPAALLTYRAFVLEQFAIAQDDPTAEQYINEIGDDERVNYEQYITTVNSKQSVAPLRYDYSAEQYKQGRHPVSHLHIGHANELRIGTGRIMKPLSFLLLVLRQFHPDHWDKLNEHDDIGVYCRNVRDTLDEIDADFYSERDRRELYLQ